MEYVWLYVAYKAPIWDMTAEAHSNGENRISNFHLWRNIFVYTVGNDILQLYLCIAVKYNFSQYIYLTEYLPKW